MAGGAFYHEFKSQPAVNDAATVARSFTTRCSYPQSPGPQPPFEYLKGGTSPASVASATCVGYDRTKLTIVPISGGFTVSDGTRSFGRYSQEPNAAGAARVMTQYREYCVIQGQIYPGLPDMLTFWR